MKQTYLLLIFLFPYFLAAQDNQGFMQFKLASNLVDKADWIATVGDSIQIETLKFYISNVQFFQNDSCVDTLDKQYILVDFESLATQKIALTRKNNKAFNRIKFNLGIDSLTNVSGAFGGDLDPTTGMYWTWQSGYINFELEGYSPSCPARHHFFQFHIGGYQYPYYSLQTIELEVSNPNDIIIELELEKLLEGINLGTDYEIMSPNQSAMDFAKQLKTAFRTIP